MNDNHNHALEEVLAGTVPQARPEFQQALEEQLMLTMQERMEMKPMSIDRDTKPRRIPRGLSVSLAATFAMILFGGLAAFIASGQLPMFSGAAQQQQADSIPQDIVSTATAIILQATYQAAEAQFMTSQSEFDIVARQATEQAAASNPDQPMTSVVQTATAVVQQATQRASGDLFLTPLAGPELTASALVQRGTELAGTFVFVTPDAAEKTATAIIQRATDVAAMLWTETAQASMPTLVPTATPIDSVSVDAVPQTCPPDKLVVYTAPGTHNPVLTSIDPLTADKYQVAGVLTLHDSGEVWFLVTFAYEGEEAQGWVQANELNPTCHPTAVVSAVTLATPTMIPLVDATPAFTVTPIPSVVPADSAPVPVVEQMDDGSYHITLPIAEEPVAEIEPGDTVYVLAEMSYGTDGRAWTVVAQDVQVIDLLEPAADAQGRFRWMDVVLASPDEETMALLQDMAAAGIAFSLERTP